MRQTRKMLPLNLPSSSSTPVLSPNEPPKKFTFHALPSNLFTQKSSLSFRGPPKKGTLRCLQSDFAQKPKGFSPVEQQGSLPPKVFVGYSVYKGKAALSVDPRPPEFSPLDSGAFKVSKEGFVLLQFAPASGTRQYDWSRKQLFSLSVTEMGSIISLEAKGSCEFFHDPFKGRSDEGKVRKVLKVEPLPDGSGHFFNLSVQNKLMNVDESIYIPITKAEMAVILSAFNYILPYLLGWNTFAASIKPEDPVRTNNVNTRSGADFEWSR